MCYTDRCINYLAEGRMKIKIILSLLIGAFVLTGCNTIEGAGRDIEAAGDGIEEAASESKTY